MPEHSPIEFHPLNRRLRYIDKVRSVLTAPDTEEDDTITTWQNLYKKVEPYHTALEFSENVHDTIYTFVAGKLPKFKKRVPAFQQAQGEQIDDKDLLDALVHNWFDESVAPEGQRREVLLAVAAGCTLSPYSPSLL